MPQKKNKEFIRIANISGFYGDRFSAMREMLSGGEVDFLTGDYLAELTMAILYKAKVKNPRHGYAVTFLKQMEGVMGECLERGVKLVSNAGGLNPSALAESLEGLAQKLGLRPKIAFITGDDIMDRLDKIELKHIWDDRILQSSGMFPLTANAYLGCWGIVEALRRDADIVVTGRVADTSVVMGPAAYAFDWRRDDWDSLAGAAVAGHIIECSGQASGGNYSFIHEVSDYQNMGFPIAEIRGNGDAVITKHENTGGVINVGTVTAQLMYEIDSPHYITPDVVAKFDTITLEEIAPNRVAVKNVKGAPATDTAKVTANLMGGFQNSMTMYITGLDVAKKVDIIKDLFLKSVGGEKAFQKIDFQFYENKNPEPSCNEEALSILRIAVQDSDAEKAGKLFTSKMVELALCTPPGWCMAGVPTPAAPRIVHFPSLVHKTWLKQEVIIQGECVEVSETIGYQYDTLLETKKDITPPTLVGETKKIPIGKLYAARSGDKGGNANVGIWARDPQAYQFLKNTLTINKFKELLQEMKTLRVERFEFDNLLGLNFYIYGFLGDGVAANAKMDGQAKTLGEYLRMKEIDVPISIIESSIIEI